MLPALSAYGATLNVPSQYSTIQAAVNAASSGDAIIIAAGTYFEGVVINGKDLFISGAGVGVTIIDGPNGGAAITLNNTTTATNISGLSIVGSFDGIKANSRFTLSTCAVHDNTHDGIALEDNAGGTITGCEIYNNGDDGIDIDHKVDVVIEYNDIHNNGSANENGQDGIEIRLHNDNIPSLLNIIIRYNTINFNAEDGIQIIDHSNNATNRNIQIYRNVICENERAGIGLMDSGATDEDYRAASIAEPISVINNTIYGNNHGISGGDNMTAINNLIVNNTAVGVKGINGGSTVNYNLLFGNPILQLTSNMGPNNIYDEDPLLDAQKVPSAGSPAINAGDPGCTHSNGTTCDIGAFETNTMTLPVELIDFSAVVGENKIDLQWATGSETDNAGFEVQCVRNSVSLPNETRGEGCQLNSWGKVAWVDGAGTSSVLRSYDLSISDLKAGIYKIRLKQVDFDGSVNYSDVLELELPNSDDQRILLEVYPNPVSNAEGFQVSISGQADTKVELIDVMGRSVHQVYRGSVEGNRVFRVSLSDKNLPAGPYWVLVSDGLRQTHKKVILVD